ncbi:MAG TPA: MFS transporter [Chryseosolibacter sp.]|nr:MFS transporter [Chryseosolibacter sp.]
MKTTNERVIFYIIVIAQFCGTSLWFAGNAVLPQLQAMFDWPQSHLGYLTSAIQAGFITGTFCFALLGISDRVSPARLFLISSIIASAANASAMLALSSFPLVIASRFTTGFFLAGIYPVGMKIASDWRREGLGMWLGGLVGALVLGTSFPHLLKQLPQLSNPYSVLAIVSVLALAGGVFLYATLTDGPYRKFASRFSFRAVRQAFASGAFRRAAFGYFGHMWELYAMWAFVPAFLMQYKKFQGASYSVPAMAFMVIGSGGIGCITGGQISKRSGSEKVARYMLFSSGICCALSAAAFQLPVWVFIPFMMFWGFTIAGDSPQFSALVARHAQAEVRGSAITMITCIGFFISILSIQLLNYLQIFFAAEYLFLFLIPGPVLGLLAMREQRTSHYIPKT